MSRVLLTGATGFVGRHALAALVRDGHEVHAVARAAGPPQADVTWHALDLLDLSAPGVALIDELRPEVIMHLAWYAAHGEFWTSTENVRWVEASLALLRAFAAAGGRRAVFAGTCAEYDWANDRLDEDAPLRPATLYGASKHALQVVAQAFCDQAGVELAWGRLFFLYGPYEDPARFVSSIILALLRGEPASMTPGTQRRDFMHTADAGDAFAALVGADVCGPVNVASGKALTLRELAETIAARIDGAELRVGARPLAPDDPPALTTAARRLREEVGWTPAIGLSEGLDQVIGWWRERLVDDARVPPSPPRRVAP
ncbi:MAG TPA: NAD(P)-dependent oxidoreductase [Solirubrobacteraceae bacterium]|jgi:nucleoside-diphosphate-sugar epimerase